MAVVIDSSKCTGTGSCIEVCASDALVLEGGKATVIEDNCIDCGQCISECPNEAIEAV